MYTQVRLSYLLSQEGKGIEPTDEIESLKREINELKDRNTALLVQVREYSETVRDHHKVSTYVCTDVCVYCTKSVPEVHGILQ